MAADAGCLADLEAGRTGRSTRLPLQLGQIPKRTLSQHCAQNVHSKLHMRASHESGASGVLQCSQVGRSSSMATPEDWIQA
jgi:hypothetical protein